MRRVSRASFLPFSGDSRQAGSADQRQLFAQSHTTAAMLELDVPAPDSAWKRSETRIASSEPVASDNVRRFGAKPFAAAPAVSKRAPITNAAQHPVVGSWRLISSEASTVHDGEVETIVTEHPEGYIMFTPWGRMMTVCVSGPGDKKKLPMPNCHEDFSDLWKRMLAYTGTYRIEGDEVVTNVEVAWYPHWAGTEQRRRFTVEGDELTIVTIPQVMGTGHRAQSMVTCKVVWQREA